MTLFRNYEFYLSKQMQLPNFDENMKAINDEFNNR